MNLPVLTQLACIIRLGLPTAARVLHVPLRLVHVLGAVAVRACLNSPASPRMDPCCHHERLGLAIASRSLWKRAASVLGDAKRLAG